MFDGTAVVAALKESGVTHVVWIPDSDLGAWEPAFRAEASLKLIRVCREGEAMVLAGGLLLAGQRPVVVIQCTGFFEAGDSLRNIVFDLKLPLFLVVGLRGFRAHQKGKTSDTCPLFAEPLMKAWQIPYTIVDPIKDTAEQVSGAYRKAQEANRAAAILLAE